MNAVEGSDEWNVVMRKARSRRDMRPLKCSSKICAHAFNNCDCDSSGINFIERAVNQDIANIDQSQGNWEKITVKVDSGAIDSCMPPEVGQAFPLQPTEASRAGLKYRAANGTEIANHGERKLQGLGADWAPIGMTLQVADVKTTLGSVNRMIQADNVVVFDKGNSYIFNKRNKKVTPMMERNGSFEVDMWIPAGPSTNKPVNQVQVKNQFQALQEKEEVNPSSEGFARREEFF